VLVGWLVGWLLACLLLGSVLVPPVHPNPWTSLFSSGKTSVLVVVVVVKASSGPSCCSRETQTAGSTVEGQFHLWTLQVWKDKQHSVQWQQVWPNSGLVFRLQLVVSNHWFHRNDFIIYFIFLFWHFILYFSFLAKCNIPEE
jgi:hypothetical protein